MFDFTFKDIQNLAQYKIKNDDDDIPLCADYLYIDRYKIMFISKFKKKYRILATSACHIRPVARLGTFDIVYFSEDFEIITNKFRQFVRMMIKLQPIEKELA